MKINKQITAHEVRVQDEDSSPIGIMKLAEALNLSYSRGVDLIEVVPGASPPVVKLQNYGRYKYELQKKEKEARKIQKANRIDVKELRFRPGTQEHDIQILVNHGKKFLQDGDRVKFTIMAKGRERERMREFVPLIKAVAEQCGKIVYVAAPTISGRNIQCIIELEK